eukprot:1921723-Rhodomonas_salina.1
MMPVGEEITTEVFKEISASKSENMEKNELFVRYIRASALRGYGYFPPALKEEIEEKEAMGDYGNLSLRCIGIVRHPPRSKQRGNVVTPGDEVLCLYDEDWSWKMQKPQASRPAVTASNPMLCWLASAQESMLS